MTTICIWMSGTVVFIERNQLHRPSEQGPAWIWPYGTVAFCERGEWHRYAEQGPAWIEPDGGVAFCEWGIKKKEKKDESKI